MVETLRTPEYCPLPGTAPNPLQLASECMFDETSTERIRKHPGANWLGLVGISLAINYSMLLKIFTSSSLTVVSREYTTDINPRLLILRLVQPNILMDDTGCTRITDFSLAAIENLR